MKISLRASCTSEMVTVAVSSFPRPSYRALMKTGKIAFKAQGPRLTQVLLRLYSLIQEAR